MMVPLAMHWYCIKSWPVAFHCHDLHLSLYNPPTTLQFPSHPPLSLPFHFTRSQMTRILSQSAAPATVIGFIGNQPSSGNEPNMYNEYSGVQLLGSYGKISTCADWSTNLSYLSGTDSIPINKANQKYWSSVAFM